MKIARILMFMFLVCASSGCMILEEDATVRLSFWMDMEVKGEERIMLLVNEEYLGDLERGVGDPECGDSRLLNYVMKKSEDLHLSIINEEKDSIDIGIVNLYSVTNGITIKPAMDAGIFVDQSLDEACALIHLHWK